MKRCPECRRDYFDDELRFCLDDGTALLEGPSSADHQTQALPTDSLPSEASTKIHVSRATGDTVTSVSSAEYIITEIKRHRAVSIIAVLILVTAVVGLGYYYFAKRDNEAVKPARRDEPQLKMQPMIASGNIREAAISPDGKFLAYTEDINGEAAVWTKQISTNSNVQIAPPSKFDYFALKFSPNGDYVFYGIWDVGAGRIYRVPTLGGPPVKIVSNAYGQISFSPDGSQIVFERYDENAPESALMIANSDGSGERKLASRTGHQYFSSPSAAWSPDGKFIAVSVGDDTVIEHQQVYATVDVATGEIREFGKTRFDAIGHASWTNDQSELVFLASADGNNTPLQIWSISFPGGESRQLTHDVAGYAYLTTTADSRSLIAVRRESFASIWYSKNGDFKTAERISRAKTEGSWGMTLAPDGRVIYVSNVSGATEVWIMNSDGSGTRQLTNDGISKYTPTATPDGRYIVFISEKGGRHLWRMNIDGSQLIQITNGQDDGNPRASPDGNWVIYDSYVNGKHVMLRVPIAGGDPQQLTDFVAWEPDPSRDGKYIAFFYVDDQDEKKLRLGVIAADGGPIVKSYDVPQSVAVDNSPMWTPDGKGITYIDWTAELSNLYVILFEGGATKQLTNYKKEHLFRREWSRDGKQLAFVLGTETSDAVMFTGLR
jgi:Tol biopolymer transport system component